MDSKTEFESKLHAHHKERSEGMGAFSVPAWCQFIALVCFACRSAQVRSAIGLGCFLIAAAIGVGVYAGFRNHPDLFVGLATLGFALILFPLLKAGEMLLMMPSERALGEFMSVIFADYALPRWLKRTFGKTLKYDRSENAE